MHSHIFTDMTGRQVALPDIPVRIVSLVPSQTELLWDLGLESSVAGITKFCVHPADWFLNKRRIGGTKTVDPERVRVLQPDLIIANKEENVREQVEELAREFPVWVSDIRTIPQALEMIIQVGALTGKSSEAEQIADQIRTGFRGLRRDTTPRSVAYLIWRQPWMTVGQDTFIHDMLQTIGWTNVFGDEERYPEITLTQLAGRAPEIVLLSSEPYPFREKHIAELQSSLPGSRILLADGEMFSWYGSRMKHALPYLQDFIKTIPS
jgi:ABC-type Fe3+-hydroxamate transport system substrate-binding protein